jgi:hypothetical protein
MAVYKFKTNSLKTPLKYSSFLAGNDVFVPSSYESIATTIGNGTSDEIIFSSIPSTYTHLQIRGIANAGGTVNTMNVRLNGDSASNYTRHRLIGDRSTAGTVGQTSQSQTPFLSSTGLPSLSNSYGAFIIDILDYTNTNKYTTTRVFAGVENNLGGSSCVELTSGLWLNTSAVTSVTVRLNGGAYTVPSQIALYGIKGA